MNETPAQKRKRLMRRNLYRGTVCAGCRNNYYNYPNPGNGWDAAVPDGHSCWHLPLLRRGKCPQYSR